MTIYRIAISPDPETPDTFLARCPDVQGVHTFGRSPAEAEGRLREALALAVGDDEAERAEFVEVEP